MGPPQNVFGNIVEANTRINKKKLFIKKYENETKRMIRADLEWSPDIPRSENSAGSQTEDLSNERVRFTPESVHREIKTDQSMYGHMSYNVEESSVPQMYDMYNSQTNRQSQEPQMNNYIKQESYHPQIKSESSEPQMYDLYNSQTNRQSEEPHMYNYIKQESYHDSVPHAHRLHASMPPSYHNDSRNDYSNYASINSIPFSSLKLCGDKNYFSPVHNSEQESQSDLMNYTSNDIDPYCQNHEYFQSGHLAQSEANEDFSLSRTENFHRQHRDTKPGSYDSFGGYNEEEQPLDLTMRRSYDLTIGNEEDEDDILSKQSSEAGSPFYPPDEETDDEAKNLLKKIKTGTRSRVRSPKSWEFLLRMLLDERFNPSLIRWEDPKIGSFRLVKKDEIAKIWGMRSVKHKDGGLTYDNFARNLRYHYKTKMLLPVSEKHLVYQFGDGIMEQLKENGTYAFT